MNAHLEANDRLNEAQRFAELLLLASEGLESDDAGPIGAGVHAIMERLREVDHFLSEERRIAREEREAIWQLGRDYDEALAAFNSATATAEAASDDADIEEAEKLAEERHDQARDALFAFQPETQDGLAAKAKILLRVWNRAEGMTDERIVQLLQSMGGQRCAS